MTRLGPVAKSLVSGQVLWKKRKPSLTLKSREGCWLRMLKKPRVFCIFKHIYIYIYIYTVYIFKCIYKYKSVYIYIYKEYVNIYWIEPESKMPLLPQSIVAGKHFEPPCPKWYSSTWWNLMDFLLKSRCKGNTIILLVVALPSYSGKMKAYRDTKNIVILLVTGILGKFTTQTIRDFTQQFLAPHVREDFSRRYHVEGWNPKQPPGMVLKAFK